MTEHHHRIESNRIRFSRIVHLYILGVGMRC